MQNDLLIKSMFVRNIVFRFIARYWIHKLSGNNCESDDETGLLQNITNLLKVYIHDYYFMWPKEYGTQFLPIKLDSQETEMIAST